MEPIKKLFQNDFFSNIKKKKEQIDACDYQLKKLLPISQHSEVRVINLMDQIMIVEVSSNVMANQLKLLKPKFLKQFSADNLLIKDLKVKVNPNKSQLRVDRAKVKNLGRSQLEKLAQKLNSSPLKQKLSKILKK
ncbi:MAG: DUF721 domain-containing protein [Methylophilaceae bacterium]|nr:DUF721 domain-containing protein [Methylophilaceae bacterium]MBL6726518.1 DUF721 domain-containing protein [Methylophilaceae bacterium]MBL6728194.1 DUF721 domain-containing protein [Methylophilaceae bacterium]MBL6791570.1 DUF721 domain-containing protein [Methylophilaceae bacterium]